MEPIILSDYESQLVYLSKGHFKYDDLYQALIKLREKYYLVHEPQENKGNYVQTLSDIAYYGLFTLCTEKLYSMIFAKEHYRREFFSETLGYKLWMIGDWHDGQINTLLDYREFTVKNIIKKLISMLSTLQIYEYEKPIDYKNFNADRGKLLELIHLQPIDSSILELRKEEK